jgi:hypothetical protein
LRAAWASAGEPSRLWAAIEVSLRAHDEFLCGYLDGPPQTNDVARSSALLGAALLISERTGPALSWHEIGASAGLNLAFDRYHYELGGPSYGDATVPVVIRSRWEGKVPSLETPFEVIERSGADLHPIDPASESDPGLTAFDELGCARDNRTAPLVRVKWYAPKQIIYPCQKPSNVRMLLE